MNGDATENSTSKKATTEDDGPDNSEEDDDSDDDGEEFVVENIQKHKEEKGTGASCVSDGVSHC